MLPPADEDSPRVAIGLQPALAAAGEGWEGKLPTGRCCPRLGSLGQVKHFRDHVDRTRGPGKHIVPESVCTRRDVAGKAPPQILRDRSARPNRTNTPESLAGVGDAQEQANGLIAVRPGYAFVRKHSTHESKYRPSSEALASPFIAILTAKPTQSPSHCRKYD